jgi:hypothetical protein
MYTVANEYKLRCLIQLGYLASIKKDLVDAGRKFKEAYTLCVEILEFYLKRCKALINFEDENTFYMNLHLVEKA